MKPLFPTLALLLGLVLAAPVLAIDYEKPESEPAKVLPPYVTPVEEQPEFADPGASDSGYAGRRQRQRGDTFRDQYLPERTILPSDCLGGYTYGLVSGRSACIRCQPGFRIIQSEGVHVCVACPRGYQGRVWRRGFVCIKCPEGGKVMEQQGKLKCLKCPEDFMLGENFQGTTCVRY